MSFSYISYKFRANFRVVMLTLLGLALISLIITGYINNKFDYAWILQAAVLILSFIYIYTLKISPPVITTQVVSEPTPTPDQTLPPTE